MRFSLLFPLTPYVLCAVVVCAFDSISFFVIVNAYKSNIDRSVFFLPLSQSCAEALVHTRQWGLCKGNIRLQKKR